MFFSNLPFKKPRSKPASPFSDVNIKPRILPFSFYSEVRQSLSNAQSQYSQWCMLLDSEVDPDKIQTVGSELKNLIKSIDWDLEDLEQTISIFYT